MQKVIFYCINDDWTNFVPKLCEQLYSDNERVLLLCDDDEEVSFLDSKLWTFSKLSFIPHGSKFSISSTDGEHCAVWIASTPVYYNAPNCLVHNGLTLSNDVLNNFVTIVDIFHESKFSEATERKKQYTNITNIKCWKNTNDGWKNVDL